MSYITFHDISQWQGDYNDGNPVIAIKMSGGDAGLYYDSRATINYSRAASAGKAIIGYHFAGGTDPIHEADFFVRAMSPLAEGDILALDWEVQHADPVGWCLQFVMRVHESTGVWPLIYMNTSTCRAYDWNPVLASCGLWIADYRFTPDQDVPCGHPYIIHQYQGSPLDTDALFIPLEDFKQYGYHADVPVAAPIQNIPTPVVSPPTVVQDTPGQYQPNVAAPAPPADPAPQEPEPSPAPSTPPEPASPTGPPPPISPGEATLSWLDRLLALLRDLIAKLTSKGR